MGIFGAMLTAVSGLSAQSYALENISGNIANSQTTAFKRVDTSFVDLVPEQPYKREVSGSVGAFSRQTNGLQGSLQTTGVATNIALNGEGYFVVQQRTGTSNNAPLFTGSSKYTRRGDFAVDKDGYLVNGTGFYLKGSSVDPVTGDTQASDSVIKISKEPIAATRTTEIGYKANLPSRPATSDADTAVPRSELLRPSTFTVNPTTTGSNTVIANDQPTFLNESISGGSVNVFSDVGAPIEVQLRWGKVDSTTYGGTDTWNLFYRESSTATGTQVAWRNVGTPITFASNGQMTSATSIAIPNLTVDGTSVGGPVNLSFGANGLSQYASANGLVEASTISQDGSASGKLDSIGITTDGRISGNYSNGKVVQLALISVARFNADEALKRLDGGALEQTLESGQPILGLNESTVVGGAVEQSNTDIAEEFAKMIVTQQAYSANTRVVTTAQQMLSDVINIIR